MNKKSRMYEVDGTRVKTWNPFVGCKFNCSYCYAPEIYKRFSKCDKCKAFTPHFHPERLTQNFKPGETVFVCSMGDISFAEFSDWCFILAQIDRYEKTTFLIQSKNPQFFHRRVDYPLNVVLGTTMESNYINDSSNAPSTAARFSYLLALEHPRKYITIEPIFDFNLDNMIRIVKVVAPEFVYIGYLNPEWKAKKLQLVEPPLQKTLELIEELKKFTEVRLKTIRKAWNEK